jgi:hypothetical protein
MFQFQAQAQGHVIIPPHVQLQEAHEAYVQQQLQMKEMFEAEADSNSNSLSNNSTPPVGNDDDSNSAELGEPLAVHHQQQVPLQIPMAGDDNNNDQADDVNNNTTDPQLQQIQQQQQQEHLLLIQQQQQRQAQQPQRPHVIENVKEEGDKAKKDKGKKKKKKKKKNRFVTIIDSDGGIRKTDRTNSVSAQPNENGIGEGHDENDQPEKILPVEIE